MAKKAYARRPNGGSIQIATNHTDDPTQDAEDTNTDGQIQIDHVRPSRYFGSVGESPNSRSQETLAVILPEPWQPSDLSKNGGAIDQSTLLNRTPWKNNGITDQDGLGIVPNFLLDYENLPAVIPDALQSNHVRSSVATRWDANGNLVEDSAGTLRLQRDPATGDVLGLLYESKRTQKFSAPTDIADAAWTKRSVTITSNVGSAKGRDFDEITEDSSSGFHLVKESLSSSDGEPLAFSAILKENGRKWASPRFVIDDGNTTNAQSAWFDIANGTVGSASAPNATIIEKAIKDLGGGWFRVFWVINPDAGFSLNSGDVQLLLANGDGGGGYQGDGKGIYVMHVQAEVSREVTSPILQGGGVREGDEVNYGFSFPDRTTGVAYSIEQQAGGAYSGFYPVGGNRNLGSIWFGGGTNDKHSVLMEHQGLNGLDTDGYKKVTRNSDEDAASGVSPGEETITAFKVDSRGEIYTIRQIAIWTQTLTSTQLSDLDSNYLTTP